MRANIGWQALHTAEEVAKANGVESVILHARPTAICFYEKLGYIATGNIAGHDGDIEPEMAKIRK